MGNHFIPLNGQGVLGPVAPSAILASNSLAKEEQAVRRVPADLSSVGLLLSPAKPWPWSASLLILNAVTLAVVLLSLTLMVPAPRGTTPALALCLPDLCT